MLFRSASFAKLYYLIFFGKPTKIKVSDGKYPKLQLAMGLLVAIMVFIGIRPEFFANNIAVPAARVLGIEDAAISLVGLSFWNLKDIGGMIITLILGMLVCWGGLKSGAFHWQPPFWLTLEGLGKQFCLGISFLWRIGAKMYNYLATAVSNLGTNMKSRIFLDSQRFDKSRSGNIGGIELMGISADVALLIIMLLLLIVCYTLVNPGLPNL